MDWGQAVFRLELGGFQIGLGPGSFQIGPRRFSDWGQAVFRLDWNQAIFRLGPGGFQQRVLEASDGAGVDAR